MNSIDNTNKTYQKVMGDAHKTFEKIQEIINAESNLCAQLLIGISVGSQTLTFLKDRCASKTMLLQIEAALEILTRISTGIINSADGQEK